MTTNTMNITVRTFARGCRSVGQLRPRGSHCFLFLGSQGPSASGARLISQESFFSITHHLAASFTDYSISRGYTRSFHVSRALAHLVFCLLSPGSPMGYAHQHCTPCLHVLLKGSGLCFSILGSNLCSATNQPLGFELILFRTLVWR